MLLLVDLQRNTHILKLLFPGNISRSKEVMILHVAHLRKIPNYLPYLSQET